MLIARVRLVCLVVVAAPVLAPPIARADAPAAPAAAAAIKNGKRTTVEVKDVERRFTKPQIPAPAPKEKGPRLRAEDLQMRRGVIQKIMANQVQKMRALVQVTADDDPQKPDFFFRLGELYVEKQRYFFDQAHALDQKISTCRRPSAAAAGHAATLPARGTDVDAGGGEGVHRRNPLPEVRPHGRGALPPRRRS